MQNIEITIRDKIASAVGSPEIICGNSDYTVTFSFDSEWDNYSRKTARFRFYKDGMLGCYDVQFSGNTVAVPVLNDIYEVEIGVYAGNIETSTGARITCTRSITDGDAVHDPPAPDVYNQLMEYLAGIQGGGGAQVGSAVPALYGTAMSRIGTPEYPLLQGTIPIVQGGWSSGNGTPITSYTPDDNPEYGGIRCRSDKIYKIPAGKTATISMSNSGFKMYIRTTNVWQILTSSTDWIDVPHTIDNSTGESDVFVAMGFRDADDAAITPSDVGTVTATLD